MNNMILCFQETRTNFPPSKTKFSRYNFNTSYSVHDVLSCIEKNIDIIANKNFCNEKVELAMSELYIQQHICIMNIYAAPFSSASTIIETISSAKAEMLHSNNIVLIIGDFNINIHANNQRSKQLTEYMHSQHLHEITNKSTPETKSHIDHIWTNLPSQHCEVNILEAYWSDHEGIYALLQFL